MEHVVKLTEDARQTAPRDPEMALRSAQVATEIANRLGDPRAKALAARATAVCWRAYGRYSDSLTAYEEAIHWSKETNDELLIAQIQIGYVDSLGRLGRYEEALQLAERLEHNLRELGAPLDAARVLTNEGNLYFQRDEYTKALDCYQRAIIVFQHLGDGPAIARLQASCANCLVPLNRVGDALEMLQTARTSFEEANELANVAATDGNIAYLYFAMGQYHQSLQTINRSRAAFELLGMNKDVAKCDMDIAEVYLELNLYPEALEAYQRVLPYFVKLQIQPEIARAELGMAIGLIGVNRIGEALDHLQSSERLFWLESNEIQIARTHLHRAYLLRKSANLGSIRYAISAARTFQRHRLPGWAACARFILIEEQLRRGKHATKQMEAIIADAHHHAMHSLEFRARCALSYWNRRRGHIALARKQLEAAISAMNRTRELIPTEDLQIAYLYDKSEAYDNLVTLILDEDSPNSVSNSFFFVEQAKSQVLLEQILNQPTIRSDATNGVERLQAKLQTLRHRLNLSYRQMHQIETADSRKTTTSPLARTQLNRLEREYERVRRQLQIISHKDNHTSAHNEQDVIERISATLMRDETLIEYYFAGDELLAYVLDQGGLHVRRRIAKKDEIERAVISLRFQLQKFDLGAEYLKRHEKHLLISVSHSLSKLYDLTLRPLEALIQHHKLIIVPHGLLHSVPFHALSMDGQWAVDRWEMTTAPSASIWQICRTRPPAPDGIALIMGAISPIAQTQNVGNEVQYIRHQLPRAELYWGEDASLQNLKEHAAHARILHIAAHAIHRYDNPLFSGIQLSNGWLIASDLYGLSLQTDLVTLSACQTGLSQIAPGDELIGLIRGFLHAGARSVAVSLWPADDASTTCLMQSFYGHLAKGFTKAEALRLAQFEVRQNYPHPYYWAAFMLVGDR